MTDRLLGIVQNDVVKPRRDTLAGEAWALFDELGRNFTVGTALKEANHRDLNPNNIRTELCRWRKFHGIRM